MFKLALRQRTILLMLFCCVMFGLVFGHTIWSHFSHEVSISGSVHQNIPSQWKVLFSSHPRRGHNSLHPLRLSGKYI